MDQNVLHNLTYGMYIVSSNKDDLLNAQIANTVFQITNNPITIAVSINKENLTHEFINYSNHLSVSVLEEVTPLKLIGNFGFKSGRDINKFENINYKILDSGCPVVLDNSLCFMYAKIKNSFDCGTHTLFFGEVEGSEIIKQGKLMTYEFYHLVKRGMTPKSAPTFIKNEKI